MPPKKLAKADTTGQSIPKLLEDEEMWLQREQG
jgi:hypothetical protein